MREIYVDILVFLNTVINFFLLLITASVAGRRTKAGRVLLAAFLGGIYALILLLPQLSGPVLTVTRLAVSALMTAVAFPFRSIRAYLFQWGLLYLAAFLFSGLMVALWFLFAPDGMVFSNGVVYFHIPAAVLVLGVLAVYGAVLLASRRRRLGSERELVEVRIGFGGEEAHLWGMVDTGNRLFDPFSGCPVVVCRYQALSHLLPETLCRCIEAPSPQRMEEAAASGARFIPFEALGRSGVLPAIRPKRLLIRQDGQYYEVEQVYAAIADQDFFGGSCSVLLHPQLQRLNNKKHQKDGRGDRHGKKLAGLAGRPVGAAAGRTEPGLLHQRARKPSTSFEPGGRSGGFPAAGERSESAGEADRT